MTNNIMANLSDSVNIFKQSLLSYISNNYDQIIDGLPYRQYCIQEAIFCLIEMERSARTLTDLPLKDQKQIIFWAVQMRDEAKRVLKKDFDLIYNVVLNGHESRTDN